MDSSRAMDSLKTRLKQSIESKFGVAVARYSNFQVPIALSKSKLVPLLDHKGWNITANNAAQLSDKANELLVSRFAIKFSFNSGDAEFFNYSIALRNYLSHLSEGSRHNFKNTAANISENVNLPLKDNMVKIEQYLKATTTGGIARVEFIASRFKQIATSI